MATKKSPSKARQKAPASKSVKDLAPKTNKSKDDVVGGYGPFRKPWK
jgi:hypothetical protein